MKKMISNRVYVSLKCHHFIFTCFSNLTLYIRRGRGWLSNFIDHVAVMIEYIGKGNNTVEDKLIKPFMLSMVI